VENGASNTQPGTTSLSNLMKIYQAVQKLMVVGGGEQTDAQDGLLISLFPISKTRLKTLGPLQVTKICTILTSKETLFDEVMTGPDRDVDAPGRLIIWHSFKPIILKYLLNIYLVEGGEK
jgi:hypothetical protein